MKIQTDFELCLLLFVVTMKLSASWKAESPPGFPLGNRPYNIANRQDCLCLTWTNWITIGSPKYLKDLHRIIKSPANIMKYRLTISDLTDVDICTVPVNSDCRILVESARQSSPHKIISTKSCLHHYGDSTPLELQVIQIRFLCWDSSDCPCLRWSKWYNNDKPNREGDSEILGKTISHYDWPCPKAIRPLDVECRTTDGRKMSDTKNRMLQCDLNGFRCLNDLQMEECDCEDYMVRFLCPISASPEDSYSAPWKDAGRWQKQFLSGHYAGELPRYNKDNIGPAANKYGEARKEVPDAEEKLEIFETTALPRLPPEESLLIDGVESKADGQLVPLECDEDALTESPTFLKNCVYKKGDRKPFIPKGPSVGGGGRDWYRPPPYKDDDGRGWRPWAPWRPSSPEKPMWYGHPKERPMQYFPHYKYKSEEKILIEFVKALIIEYLEDKKPNLLQPRPLEVLNRTTNIVGKPTDVTKIPKTSQTSQMTAKDIVPIATTASYGAETMGFHKPENDSTTERSNPVTMEAVVTAIDRNETITRNVTAGILEAAVVLVNSSTEDTEFEASGAPEELADVLNTTVIEETGKEIRINKTDDAEEAHVRKESNESIQFEVTEVTIQNYTTTEEYTEAILSEGFIQRNSSDDSPAKNDSIAGIDVEPPKDTIDNVVELEIATEAVLSEGISQLNSSNETIPVHEVNLDIENVTRLNASSTSSSTDEVSVAKEEVQEENVDGKLLDEERNFTAVQPQQANVTDSTKMLQESRNCTQVIVKMCEESNVSVKDPEGKKEMQLETKPEETDVVDTKCKDKVGGMREIADEETGDSDWTSTTTMGTNLVEDWVNEPRFANWKEDRKGGIPEVNYEELVPFYSKVKHDKNVVQETAILSRKYQSFDNRMFEVYLKNMCDLLQHNESYEYDVLNNLKSDCEKYYR